MQFKEYAFKDLLINIVDNRGKTCPTVEDGLPLIATNCIKNGALYPVHEKLRFVDDETYQNWFRDHPKPGDIIFVCKGSPGRVCWTPDPVDFCIAQDMLALRADETKVHPKYLFALLRSDETQRKILNMHVGTLIPHFKKGDFGNLYFDIPTDLEYQKQVGEAYFEFCNKIELNRQTNQTLEEMAQAVFKSWFVDFEPTRAKIKAIENGQDPTCAAMAAIAGKTVDQLDTLSADQIKSLTTTANLFPDALVDSELGGIPMDWVVEKLSHEIEILNGFAFKSKDYSVEGTFVLRTKNFNKQNGTDRLHDDVFLPDEFLISHKKYLSKAYDYHLIMVGASVGNRGIIYPCHLPALRNQNMWCFRAKPSSIVTQPFAKYLLDMLVGKSSGLASGSAREFFRKGDFGDQKICIGTAHIQDKFFQYAMPLLERMAALTDENQNLEALRDTLLPKLLSGEIDVSNLIEAEK